MSVSTSKVANPSDGERDLLLTAIWWLLTGLLVLCVVLGVCALASYPVLLVYKSSVAGEFARMGMSPSTLPWVGALGALVAAVMALTFLFLRHLRRIIDSVAEGRPFDPANADRLRRMAWLSIGAQLLLVPMTRLIFWFDAMPDKPNVHHNSDGVSIGSIVLTLVLFVLARVFRTGAQIQDDLEGTV